MRPPTAEPIDIAERGANGQKSDRRLFIQLQVFTGFGGDHAALAGALGASGLAHVLYADANDARRVGLLTLTERPAELVERLHPLLRAGPWGALQAVPEYTMLGRTYALGYEPDLQDTLTGRPLRYALDPATPWAVWYPLRRAGEFEALPREEQTAILREHGEIGFRFGAAGLARDIRLACHGLGGADNDFIIALLGAELAPLSVLVNTMRRTKQTSVYVQSIGPFFVGRRVWAGDLPAAG